MTNISGAQIRAARALLRWSAADLVRESGVSPATINRAESTDGKTTMTFANASAIRRALENAGVELIEENGGGLGARLRRGLELIDESGGGPGERLRRPPKQKRGEPGTGGDYVGREADQREPCSTLEGGAAARRGARSATSRKARMTYKIQLAVQFVQISQNE